MIKINKKNLAKIVEYYWEEEKIHFYQEFDAPESLLYSGEDEDIDIETLLKWCKDNKATNHIFYNFLILKQNLSKEKHIVKKEIINKSNN